MTQPQGTTTATPGAGANSGAETVEGPKATSAAPPTESKTAPEERKQTGIFWSEVLGSRRPADQQLVRERQRTEAQVSPELVELTKQGLTEAALVYGKGLDQSGEPDANKVGNLTALAKILRQINPEINFADQQAVASAVEALMNKYPGQAVALATAYQELKLKALSQVYEFKVEGISPTIPAGQSLVPQENQMIINPDGSISLQQTTMKYEEFIKTPSGRQPLEGIFGSILPFTRPISRDEFENMLKGTAGKQGTYKITIETENNPHLDEFQKFLLAQLDLYNSENLNESPDPTKREDFIWLLQEYQRSMLVRSEIAKATGVPSTELVNVFQGNFLSDILSGVSVDTIKQRIEEQMQAEQKKNKQETQKRLEEQKRQRVVEASRRQLEARIGELEKELEEAKKREKESGSDQETITADKISGEVVQRLQGLNFSGKMDDLLKLANLPLPEGEASEQEVLSALEIQKAEIEAQLQARASD